MEIISLCNYRFTIPLGSDLLFYSQFPEVYHAHGITTPPFSGGERAVTGQGVNTIYRRKSSLTSGTSCVFVQMRAGGCKEDPELPFFGSDRDQQLSLPLQL
jgi:hypothetical protein